MQWQKMGGDSKTLARLFHEAVGLEMIHVAQKPGMDGRTMKQMKLAPCLSLSLNQDRER